MKKTKDKARKEKKKAHWEERKQWESNTLAIRNNAKSFIKTEKKQKNFSWIICFSYNKKDYYLKNYTKP